MVTKVVTKWLQKWLQMKGINTMDQNNTDSNKKCIWSKYECINDFMDKDFVCSYYRGQFCYSDESCVHYEPEERKDTE